MPHAEQLSERHPHSRRTAIIADEGDSVWLYLTAADGATVVADCWLANRIAAPSYRELRDVATDYRARELPPPAIREVVTERALAADLAPLSDFGFRWAADGESVAAMRGGDPIGFIAQGDQHGYSRGLREVSPWGTPLDRSLYAELFAMMM
jgi:hypothetical protein